MQELADPSLSLDRARETYRKQGAVTEVWPSAGQETRNKLTDYWATHEVKPSQEFAIFTNLIHEEWTGIPLSSQPRGTRNSRASSPRTSATT